MATQACIPSRSVSAFWDKSTLVTYRGRSVAGNRDGPVLE